MALINKFKDNIADKYLTWRTGRNAEERALIKWNNENLHVSSRTVKGFFGTYKHIIEVDWEKIYGYDIAYFIKRDFRERYCYPYRELGDHCTVEMWRGEYFPDEIMSDNAFGGDHVFVGTNNDEDAIMIALRYK